MDGGKQNHEDESNHTNLKTNTRQYKPVYSLLGDIGGTNMRFSLCLIQPPHDIYLERVKKAKLLVKENDNFQQAIRNFLSDVPKQKYPQVAVIGVAGPVEDNKVKLSNVQKWGQLNGQKLGQSLKIKDFVFLNDSIANSYGLLIVPQTDFVQLNKKAVNPKHIRGVLSPGTGLGNSVIYSAPFRKRERIYVLPSQGGHADTPYLNELTGEYLKFIGQKIGHSYVGLQYSFCGPAIPYMYQFFALKNPAYQGAHLKPTAQQIITTYMGNRQADTLEKKAVEWFIQLYTSTICNFILQHMCTGGMYLVGGLTIAVLDRLQQIDLTAKACERHPQIARLLKETPIVVCKQVDLGLKGAYVYARRIIADQQHD